MVLYLWHQEGSSAVMMSDVTMTFSINPGTHRRRQKTQDLCLTSDRGP